MKKQHKITFFVLRITMGWYMFYAGITKVLDPSWSAEGYIRGANHFVWFYQWLLHPNILPVINFLNAWGLTLLGISLILGIFVRLSSIFGALLMFLYYLAALNFPYPNEHAYLVDEHIIYIIVLLLFYSFHVGKVWGIDHFIYRNR